MENEMEEIPFHFPAWKMKWKKFHFIFHLENETIKKLFIFYLGNLNGGFLLHACYVCADVYSLS